MERILIADSKESDALVAEVILKDAGYDTKVVGTGKEALAELGEKRYDLLLLSKKLSDMTGIEALEVIRSIPEIEDIKVLYSAEPFALGDLTEEIRLGVLNFVKIPYEPEELLMLTGQAFYRKSKDYVLVVDDEKVNLLMSKKLFGIRYEVECVSSGRLALEKIAERKPDLILLDYHMPEMNGLELMEELGTREDWESIPVVFLTGDFDDNTEVKIFKAGAMDFIRKPLIPQVAIQRINRILDLKHTQDYMLRQLEEKDKEIEELKKRLGE